MIMKRAISGLWMILIMSLAISACTTSEDQEDLPPTPTPAGSGVEGYVWIGPTCPVVHVGTECPDRPYETGLTVIDTEGQDIISGRSDEAGYFRLLLPPGNYILVPEIPNPNAPPFADPIPFDVELGSFTQITVSYDSGMR
jgi:hypothetical protein